MPLLRHLAFIALVACGTALHAADATSKLTDYRVANEKQHAAFLARIASGPIDLLFVGDSITWGWSSQGKDVFATRFGRYRTANFGISGSGLQHLIWGARNGQLDGFTARCIVLMAGVNNQWEREEDIVAAMRLLLEEIRKRQPQARILLLGILPSKPKPTPLREKFARVNAGYRGLADGTTITFLDIGDRFLEPDGSISVEVMKDGTHPATRGYGIFADAIGPTVDRLMAP